MFLNITDKNEADNKGSSAKLVHYLGKENRLETSIEQWFGHDLQTFESYQVRNLIDANIAKLGHKDAKFFLLNISPSQKEIVHLKSLFGEDGAKQELKSFAVRIMDEYARNFKRKGIEGNKDLLWFAKLEHHRYYTYKDKEVKNGRAKRGDQKPGEQMHIQVIISRKDITNRIKLSPKNNSRGNNVEHSKKVGQFDRVAFKASGERVFDESYHFVRPVSETFQYVNTRANGSLADRLAVAMQNLNKKSEPPFPQQDRQQRTEKIDLENADDKVRQNLLDTLLAKPEFDPMVLSGKKKRRKKRKGQDQGLNFN
ncbi:DUF5712 family protein [Pedobacter panaciterrae]|uniref:DUF5712 family protein n=1 Tax=Pedobacter panaciterrae TaxID=363849 RepID=A0ABU8NHK8_9SPHI